METYLPNPVNSKKSFAAAWNKLLDWCRRNTLQSNDEILVTQTTHGTSLKLAKKSANNKSGLQWKSTYNLSSSYAVNDCVWVDPNTVYPVAWIYNNATVPLSAGTFVCVNSVPEYSTRNIYNIYYPIYPNIPSGSRAVIAISGAYSGAYANQIFWEPITPMTPGSICINGESKTVFVASVLSGSAFNPDSLPYPP